ncbi:MAG: transcriptional regulator, partial [Blastococcus sp.]|nr:transcriptional regulator [Blastococcus sp.]
MDAREIDMQALGERIQAARGSRDWNQTQLAAAAGLSQPTVSRIEKGQRPVTLVEADAVARALEIPLDTLLYGSGVAERVLVALRVAESAADRATAVGPGVELLELDERLDAVLAEFRQESHSAPVRPRRSGSPTTVGARLAFDLRQELQLGAAPITELPELIEEVTGVDVATRPLPGISGMCLDDPGRDTRLLVVNSDEPAERQRFTLAHELGHLLFGDGAHVDDLDGEDRESETRCHEFARNLLLPPEGVTGWLKRNTGATSGPVDEQIVSRLARYFGVSSEVVKIQLERMGLRPDRPVPSTPTLAARYG